MGRRDAQRQLTSAGECVFDAYGTLFDFHSAAAHCRDGLVDKAGALSSLWRSKQLEYTWLRSLMGAHVDFWQVTGDALDYAMAATDLRGTSLRENLMALYLALDAYPEVPGVLAVDRLDLAAGSICFMSSNARDAVGAAHFGFQFAWVNFFGQPKERLPGEPKAEINFLKPLPGLLCV